MVPRFPGFRTRGRNRFFSSLKSALADAVAVFVRYDQPDDKDETRRMRNERAEVESPALEIPEAGQYLFDLYFDASRAVSRIRDGLCARIDPTQWLAYFTLMKIEIRPWEYECLVAMDTEFCKETQAEINAIGEKRRAEMDKQGRGRR